MDEDFHTMISLLKRFMDDSSGATAIEYGLIGGLLLACSIAAFGMFKDSLNARFDELGTSLNMIK